MSVEQCQVGLMVADLGRSQESIRLSMDD